MAYFHTTVLDNQIKALPTVDTASGSIATFDTDMTENLVEVECEIIYQQASGTPSPSNPLPITTFSEMNVVQMSDITNKSFFDGLLNGTYGFVDLGSLTWTKDTTTLSVPVFRAPINDRTIGTLYGICDKYFASTDTRDYLVTHDMSMTRWNATGTNIAVRDDSLSSGTAVEFTTAVTGVYLIYELATPITPTITKAQFETLLTAFGIDGSLYNVSFGQPVAKGTLNVTTGVLEITWIEVYLNSLTWTYDNVYNRFYTIISNRKRYNARLTPFSCSCYLPITDGRPLVEVPNLACYFGGFNDNTFYVHDSNYTDATTFDNSLGDNTICYPLQTPQVIQLDSTQIQALLNENNIWCDTGDTEVKYLLTVGKKIS